MTLTKKHFKAIAEILKQHFEKQENLEQQDVDSLILSFCSYFKSENGLFDSNRFRNAILGEKA